MPIKNDELPLDSDDSVRAVKLEGGLYVNKDYKMPDDTENRMMVNERTGRTVLPVRTIDEMQVKNLIDVQRLEEEEFRS
jgi:hypothetical protein